MATVTTCDRCGGPCSGKYEVMVKVANAVFIVRDLCGTCQKALERFFDRLPEGD